MNHSYLGGSDAGVTGQKPDLKIGDQLYQNRDKPAKFTHRTPMGSNSAIFDHNKHKAIPNPSSPVIPLVFASSSNPNASSALSNIALPSGTVDYFITPSQGKAPVSLGNSASQRHSSHFIQQIKIKNGENINPITGEARTPSTVGILRQNMPVSSNVSSDKMPNYNSNNSNK